ncbi:hypothetical protein [Mesorhizobium sp.]|nr:hypothetical protein [Mesorhizobium sp.]
MPRSGIGSTPCTPKREWKGGLKLRLLICFGCETSLMSSTMIPAAP